MKVVFAQVTTKPSFLLHQTEREAPVEKEQMQIGSIFIYVPESSNACEILESSGAKQKKSQVQYCHVLVSNPP